MKIQVYSQNKPEIEPYREAVLSVQDELGARGIELEVIETKADPILVTFLVTIGTKIATDLVTKLIDRLLEKKKVEKEKAVNVVIMVGARKYNLPDDETKLKAALV